MPKIHIHNSGDNVVEIACFKGARSAKMHFVMESSSSSKSSVHSNQISSLSLVVQMDTRKIHLAPSSTPLKAMPASLNYCAINSQICQCSLEEPVAIYPIHALRRSGGGLQGSW